MRYIKLILLLLLVSMSFSPIRAQLSAAANFIKGGKMDAVKVISAYLLPLEKSLSFNGNNNNIMLFNPTQGKGYNVGIGFDISTSIVNKNDYTYDINSLNLQEFEASDPQSTIAQTLAGNSSTITLQSKSTITVPTTTFPFSSKTSLLSLDSPEGFNQPCIPFPTLHLFVEKQGNMIDLKIMPVFKVINPQISLFEAGINIQHNLETSLKPLANLWPDFYFTAGCNYTIIKYYLEVRPNETSLTFSSPNSMGPYTDQEFQMSSASLPVKLLIAKPIRQYAFFIGASYNFMYSQVKMVGKYPLYTSDPTNLVNVVATTISDPFVYSRYFTQYSIEAGIHYHSNHTTVGLKYAYSYYQNIDLSVGYFF